MTKDFDNPRPPTRAIEIESEEARYISDALADVLCWFQGFSAAKPDADVPASLGRLRDLNIKLKSIT